MDGILAKVDEIANLNLDKQNELTKVEKGIYSVAKREEVSRTQKMCIRDRIKEIINEKNPDLPDKDETAKKIGVGAVLFNDLYNQRIKDVSFKWEKLLNFDGETGPYVQYLSLIHIFCACIRCSSNSRLPAT